MEHEFGHADDAIHRGADLVAHVCEELALEPDGLERGITGGGQLGEDLFTDGDILGGNAKQLLTCELKECGGELDGELTAALGQVPGLEGPVAGGPQGFPKLRPGAFAQLGDDVEHAHGVELMDGIAERSTGGGICVEQAGVRGDPEHGV